MRSLAEKRSCCVWTCTRGKSRRDKRLPGGGLLTFHRRKHGVLFALNETLLTQKTSELRLRKNIFCSFLRHQNPQKAVLCLVFSRCSLLSAFLCLCFSLLLLFCSACHLSLSLLFLRFPAVSFLSSFCLFRLPSPPCLQDPEGLFSVDELFCGSLAVRERLEKIEDFLPPSLLGIPSVASRELFVHSGRSSLGGGLDVFCHSLLQVLLLRFSLPCFASVR
ncbi:putative transmembrane protein [Toxoplasma gondii RUB]|uniref:Putative transmembrane protein n=1 Tax=Toxoplasma gondii RUB TaxID=935652 RepID=A0A086LJI9_TOXGO|nr:putative transmembrane protein [Toxoplasma gondii RUB]